MPIANWYFVLCVVAAFALTGLICFHDPIATRGYEEAGSFLAVALALFLLTLPAAGFGFLLNLKLELEPLSWWPLPLIALSALTAIIFWQDPYGWEDGYYPKVGYMLLHILGIYLLVCTFIFVAGFTSSQPMLIKLCCYTALISSTALVLAIFTGGVSDIDYFLISTFFFLIASISSLITFVAIMVRKTPYDRY